MSKVMMQVMSGQETQTDGHCAVHVFLVQADKKEVFLGKAFTAVENREVGRVVGKPVFEAAVAGMRAEVGGFWNRGQYELEEGTLLKVFAKRRGAWNTLIRQGCQFIQVREAAALRKLTIQTLQRAGKSRMNEVTIVGRFDLIPLHVAIKEKGVKVLPAFERMFLPSAVESVITVEELEKEKERRDVIRTNALKTTDGDEVVVRTRQRIRAMDFK